MNDTAWTELHGRLRGFVGRRIEDLDAADDVAQEILLRVHRNFAALRDDERLDAFAYQVARNAIVDHYRERARSRETLVTPDDLAEHVDPAVSDDEDDGAREDLARCLPPLVDRLSEPYRTALVLTGLGEVSQAEAARTAGISVPGMKSRVQRARLQLHDLLSDCCAVPLDRRRQISGIERTGPCACTRISKSYEIAKEP